MGMTRWSGHEVAGHMTPTVRKQMLGSPRFLLHPPTSVIPTEQSCHRHPELCFYRDSKLSEDEALPSVGVHPEVQR